MWALINDDNSINEIIRFPRSITINNVKHPRAIFTKWSWSELNAIGIYEVLDNGVKGNDFFEYTSQATWTFNASDNNVTSSYTITDKTLTDTNDVDEDGNAVLDYKGNQTVTLGLKSIAKEKAKQQANSLIKPFNWLVERLAYDSSATIPSAVGTYVGDIKTDCAAIEAAIDGASDMAAFKALYEDTRDSDGNVTEVARINRWSDDYDVKEYVR